MAKICKSCGSYYKGSWCDKCGYGKPDSKSKELERFKKATPKKPVRFMTEEEKAAVKTAPKEKTARPKADPNARHNLLIVVLLVTVGVVVYVLISRGVLFSNKKEDVISQYFTALDNNDFDKFVDTLPKEIKNAYEDEREKENLSGEDYMRRFKEPLETVYGSGLSLKFTLGSEEKLDKEKEPEVFDMTAFKERYGSAPSVSEAYIVYVDVTYSGTLLTETVRYNCYIAKTGWKWKILNMEFDPGILAPE